MRRITDTFSTPRTQNPFVRILALIGFILLLGVALVVGAFMFVALLGLALIAGSALYLRFWWLRRQWRRRMGERGGNEYVHGAGERQRHDPRVIEGEFVREDEHKTSNRRR